MIHLLFMLHEYMLNKTPWDKKCDANQKQQLSDSQTVQ